ncbi:MAG: hypothetical protein U0736_26290 [Gemmataceae bacterium]
MLRDRSVDDAHAIVGWLVQVTRAEWPECRSFSGAVQKYLADAIRLHEQDARRTDARRRADEHRAASSATGGDDHRPHPAAGVGRTAGRRAGSDRAAGPRPARRPRAGGVRPPPLPGRDRPPSRPAPA